MRQTLVLEKEIPFITEGATIKLNDKIVARLKKAEDAKDIIVAMVKVTEQTNEIVKKTFRYSKNGTDRYDRTYGSKVLGYALVVACKGDVYNGFITNIHDVCFVLKAKNLNSLRVKYMKEILERDVTKYITK